MNTFGYVGGNPLIKIDLNGLIEVNAGGPASAGFSATGSFGSLGGGAVLRQCCLNGKKYNELIFSGRFALGLGASIQSSASGKANVPLIRVGGLPTCVTSENSGFGSALGKIDITLGNISIGVNLPARRINVGLNFKGKGRSVNFQIFNFKSSLLRSRPIGECGCEE